MDISALKKLALNFINFHNVELPHWHSPQMQVDGDRIGFIPDESHELWLAYQDGHAEAQRWIPVSERLPDDGQEVLFVSIKYAKESLLGAFQAQTKNFWANEGEGYYDNIHSVVDGHVTHWMPLPAAPAGDQQ